MGKHFYEDQIERGRAARSNDIIEEAASDLQEQIEIMRMELNELAKLNGLLGESILKKSMELDQLLNIYHYVKFKNHILR